jgi:urea transporter
MTTAPTLKHKIFTRMSANGLVIEDTKSLLHPLNFIDIILRGIGQVMLQNNSYTGLFFLIGIFYHSIMFGMVVLLGTSISTSTAIFFGANRHLYTHRAFWL